MKTKLYKTLLFLNKKHWVKEVVEKTPIRIKQFNGLGSLDVEVSIEKQTRIIKDFREYYFIPRLAVWCLIKSEPLALDKWEIVKDKVSEERMYFKS